MAKVTVLYNSVCPVCREGVCWMEKRTPTGPTGVAYFDLSQSPKAFSDRGVEINDVRRKLHAILPSGEIVKGWPAVSAIWRESRNLSWLAKVGDIPLLRPLSGLTYATTAQLLWWWNRASGRW